MAESNDNKVLHETLVKNNHVIRGLLNSLWVHGQQSMGTENDFEANEDVKNARKQIMDNETQINTIIKTDLKDEKNETPEK